MQCCKLADNCPNLTHLTIGGFGTQIFGMRSNSRRNSIYLVDKCSSLGAYVQVRRSQIWWRDVTAVMEGTNPQYFTDRIIDDAEWTQKNTRISHYVTQQMTGQFMNRFPLGPRCFCRPDQEKVMTHVGTWTERKVGPSCRAHGRFFCDADTSPVLVCNASLSKQELLREGGNSRFTFTELHTISECLFEQLLRSVCFA